MKLKTAALIAFMCIGTHALMQLCFVSTYTPQIFFQIYAFEILGVSPFRLFHGLLYPVSLLIFFGALCFGKGRFETTAEADSGTHDSGEFRHAHNTKKEITKMSKQFFLGSVIACGILSVLMSLLMIGAAMAEVTEAIIAMGIFSVLISVYLVVVFAIMWYKAWSSIQDGMARTTPGKAVGFMFIPLFNFYWVFQATWGFAKDYNDFIERHQHAAIKLPEGLFLTFAIFSLVGVVAGHIPGLNILFSIAAFVVAALTVAKVCDAVNAISTSPAPEQGEQQSEA